MTYACGHTPHLGDVVAWNEACGRIGNLYFNFGEEYLVLSIDYYCNHPQPMLDIEPDDRWGRYMRNQQHVKKLRLVRRAHQKRDWWDVFLLKPNAVQTLNHMIALNHMIES